MTYLKAFIAGLTFPATVFPLVLLALWSAGKIAILEILPIYLAPLIWGVWNVLYFAVGKRCPVKNQNLRLWVTGAVLGFLLALCVVFVFKAPSVLFGITGYLQYVPLAMITIIYSILWRYVVKYFNSLLGLKDW
ncbi:MAG: hypothetical protein JJE19_05195 [Methanosarcinales archaeon]|nr:hypothetical protein [Methanosarcinales archaeon]